MMNYLEKRNLRDYVLFVLGIYVGRRISDLLSLDVRDVAYIDKRGRLSVSDIICFIEGKTGKAAEITLNSDVKTALARYLRKRRHGQPLDALLKEPLFRSQKQRMRDRTEYRITRRQALNILVDAARACGLRYKVGTHSLRKTFGYKLHKDGQDISTIQCALNHSNQEVTLGYIGITQDIINEAVLNLRMFSTSKGKRKTPVRRPKMAATKTA